MKIKAVDHEHYMRLAAGLAKKGLGRTSPNPCVGAIVVRSGKVVGKGYHRKAGLSHAEVAAIEDAGRLAKGAVLYVTLEPCDHYGRTPPCTMRIMDAGIKEVYIGTIDPNPIVSGRGVKRLISAGIKVNIGILEKECKAINEAYEKYITKNLPFVTVKLAASMDGRIATIRGESRWITSKASRTHVHRLRALVDAVMVGGGTLKKDDPALTVRHVPGKDPVKVVLTSSFNISSKASVFKGLKQGERLIIFTSFNAPDDRVRSAVKMGAEVVMFKKTKDGISLKQVLRELAKRAITSVMIEGGARLAASALRQGLVDKVIFFYSPRIIGGDGLSMVGDLGLKRLSYAVRLRDIKATPIGEDLMVEGYIKAKKTKKICLQA
ncbi:MAG: bifunctional diaminohydroxyphosphoribosylaminopyrimidine deaminase/5-amino-6-(5-phosphoribosylamino)uracil reductase RibD [Deltaproteobacteria bacterium]|nr:bifunctional diaminohydroxyphosphoribosylaminopyrimidine deaminase/5-amino-6-(5-phosphoribosylamino)uracil reductase RibD [Deltaproteobacteria bacterium]